MGINAETNWYQQCVHEKYLKAILRYVQDNAQQIQDVVILEVVMNQKEMVTVKRICSVCMIILLFLSLGIKPAVAQKKDIWSNLIWKIWEIEEEVRERKRRDEEIQRKFLEILHDYRAKLAIAEEESGDEDMKYTYPAGEDLWGTLLLSIWELENYFREERRKIGSNTVFRQPASAEMAKARGISAYMVSLYNTQVDFDVLDNKGEPVMYVEWRGVLLEKLEGLRGSFQQALKDPSAFTHESGFSIIIKNKDARLELHRERTSGDLGWKANLRFNGKEKPIGFLLDGPGADLLHEKNVYTRDFFAQMLGEKTQTLGGNPKTIRATNPAQRKAMKGICYIAGICASIWPIGTLICGPTAVGCVVYFIAESEEEEED